MNLKQLQEIYLGEFKVLKEPQNQTELMVIERRTNQQEEMDKQIINLKNRQKIVHQNLINLKKFGKNKITSFCATVFEVKACYEYYQNNLKKEIIQRKKKNNYFSAIQILRFIYDSIDVFEFLESKGIKHNELNPILLFIYNDQEGFQRLKISERLNGFANSFSNAFNSINSNLDIYIDPKSFEDLSKGKKESTADPFKTDVFALGLIFLELGLLQSVQNIYNILGGKFQFQVLDQLFQKMQKFYSQNTLLLSIISKMLVIDENKRPTFCDLKEALPNWNQVQSISQNYLNPNEISEFSQIKEKQFQKIQNFIQPEKQISNYQSAQNQNNKKIQNQTIDYLETEKSFDDYLPSEKQSDFHKVNFQKKKHNLIISHETQDLKLFPLQNKSKKKFLKAQFLYQFAQKKQKVDKKQKISISSNPNYFFKRGSYQNKNEHQNIQLDNINFSDNNFDILSSNKIYSQKKESFQSKNNDQNYKQERNSQRQIIQEDINKENEEIFKKNNIPKFCKSENGTLYKSVVNETDEFNQNGQLIRRVYVTYEPVTDHKKILEYQSSIQEMNQNQQLPQNFNQKLQNKLDSIKETYSDTFNTLENENIEKNINQLPSLQNMKEKQPVIQESKNNLYETDFFNISESETIKNTSQKTLTDFFQSFEQEKPQILLNAFQQPQQVPQINLQQQNPLPIKNPYLKNNKVKNSLANILKEYKENESFYNSSIKENKRYAYN